MKRYVKYLLVLLTGLCFTVIMFTAYEQAKARNIEIFKLREAATLAVRSYFNDSIKARVYFSGLPICYNGNNKWIDECYIDLTDGLGAKYRTGLDVIIERENRLWKASVVKVYRNRARVREPIPEKIKKETPWELLFKSLKGR